MIEIEIEEPAWSQALPDVEALAHAAALAALAQDGAQDEGVVLLLADDAAVQELNARFRDKDKPTNVLSFPACAPEQLASAPHIGDVIIAFETTRREADEEGKALADHLSHLVVHGMLHLLGYDHETDVEAEEMEGLEVRILAGLGIADPYAGAVPGE